MHKNRNDCAKHNIIKYDIKKKQIQIIYANMHGYTSTCNRDIIDIDWACIDRYMKGTNAKQSTKNHLITHWKNLVVLHICLLKRTDNLIKVG